MNSQEFLTHIDKTVTNLKGIDSGAGLVVTAFHNLILIITKHSNTPAISYTSHENGIKSWKGHTAITKLQYNQLSMF